MLAKNHNTSSHAPSKIDFSMFVYKDIMKKYVASNKCLEKSKSNYLLTKPNQEDLQISSELVVPKSSPRRSKPLDAWFGRKEKHQHQQQPQPTRSKTEKSHQDQPQALYFPEAQEQPRSKLLQQVL